ncbi:hypothetical protein AB6A23_23660 [Paenibacillus tarimensis]
MYSEERRELNRIMRSLDAGDLVEHLSERLSGADLNTLLLEVFREKAKKTTASDLLKKYAGNRFVQPSAINPIEMKHLELDTLKIAERHAYTPVQLSPVSPLGSCSVVATSDQNKVISALRGTEVVADATNVLALHICDLVKSGKKGNAEEFVRFSTTHRHVRAQKFNDAPGVFPHFHIFCLVASGKDKGSYYFEKQAIWEQLCIYREIFKSLYGSDMEVVLSIRGGYKDAEGLVERVIRFLDEKSLKAAVAVDKAPVENEYYKGLQFTIITNLNGQTHYIGDGGFVDWSQQLLSNRKERMLISAIGLDRLILQ